MMTEEITLDNTKFVVLTINEETGFVSKAVVRSSVDLVELSTQHYNKINENVSREKAIEDARFANRL
jgi:hypothetical protein